MTSHLVLHVSYTRKYVMAVLTRIQGKLRFDNLGSSEENGQRKVEFKPLCTGEEI